MRSPEDYRLTISKYLEIFTSQKDNTQLCASEIMLGQITKICRPHLKLKQAWETGSQKTQTTNSYNFACILLIFYI